MRGQKLILVKGVYSLEKWTKPNPVMSTENRPVDISSVPSPGQSDRRSRVAGNGTKWDAVSSHTAHFENLLLEDI